MITDILNVTLCPERAEYKKFINDKEAKERLGEKSWKAILKNLKEEYKLSFHNYVAEIYEHLRFEIGEDKVYWLYNDKTGVYEELSVSSARELVIKLLIDEDLRADATSIFANNVLMRYRACYPERGSRYDDFDNQDDWFHCANGWVKLNLEKDGTRKFEPHNPERLSRRVSAVEYDPKATCPVYDNILDNKFQLKKDEIRVLDQYSGLLLTPDISKQKMIAMIGVAGSGKSTLAELWSFILGDCAFKMKLKDISSDSARFIGSSLVGRTLCWFDETEPDRTRMGDDLIGLVTANSINIERKGISGITRGRNQLKFVLTANALPRSAEIGIYRRLILFNFTYSFTDNNDIDTKIREKLESESSGVLNRMLRGLADLQKFNTFTTIEGHNEMIEDYKASSNYIAEFLEEHFTFDETADPIDTKVLVNSYKEFNGDKYSQSLTPQRFGALMKTNGLYQFRNIKNVRGAQGVRQWSGLRLKDNYEVTSAGVIHERDNF